LAKVPTHLACPPVAAEDSPYIEWVTTYADPGFEALAAHWSHPDTIRFIGGTARTPHEVWNRNVLRNRGLWQVLG